jgi:Ca-activated chloride channel family protein
MGRKPQSKFVLGCFRWGAAVVGGALLAEVLSQAQNVPPTFRGGVESIEVDVRVIDRDGKAVRDLSREDFTLLEDGVPQAITSLTFVDLGKESPLTPLSAVGAVESDIATNRGTGRMWVMMLGQRGERARLTARRFVEEAMGPNDQAAVILGSMSASQGFTRNRNLILAAIDRLEFGEDAFSDAVRARNGFQILEDVCKRLGLIAGRRKAVLYFDPPAVFGAENPALFLDQRDALRAATRNNVAVHVISTAGLSAEPGSRLVEQAGLRVLAEETGGDAVVNTNNFGDGYQRIVRDANEYYLLGYSPTAAPRDGEFHRLTVRVNRPGVTVHARPGYFAPPAVPRDRPELAPEPNSDGLSAEALDALRLPIAVSGLAVDVFAAPFRGNAPNTGAVLVGAQVNGADLTLDAGQTIEVGYRAMTSEGKTTPGRFTRFELQLQPASRVSTASSGLRFLEWYGLPAGRHQIRFVVNQPAGKTGMVVADVDVPNFEETPLSLSGVLLASERTAGHHSLKGDDSLKKLLGAEPTALRRFSRRDTLSAFVETYTDVKTSLTNVTATIASATSKRGDSIGVRPIRTERGAAALARVPLSSLRPGDYVIAFVAHAGKQSATRRVLFSVLPD